MGQQGKTATIDLWAAKDLSLRSGIRQRKLRAWLRGKRKLSAYEEKALRGAKEGRDFAPLAPKDAIFPLLRLVLFSLPLFLGSLLSWAGSSLWPMMGLDTGLRDLICEIILLSYLTYAFCRVVRRFRLAPGVRKEELLFEIGLAIVGMAYSILMLQSVLDAYPLNYERQAAFYLAIVAMAGYGAVLIQLMSYLCLLIFNILRPEK